LQEAFGLLVEGSPSMTSTFSFIAASIFFFFEKQKTTMQLNTSNNLLALLLINMKVEKN